MGYTYRGDLPQTGVRFRTEDAALQELFELAQQKAKKNIFDFGGTKVMAQANPRSFTPSSPLIKEEVFSRNLYPVSVG